jgi:hypothetical protein
MMTCALSPAGRGRAVFDWGAKVGVGMATARGGEGDASDDVPRSSARGVGVLGGLGVSSSSRVNFVFARVLDFPAVSFSRNFFLAAFGLGVGVWCRFDFGDVLASGVSRGVADGFVSSDSADSLAGRGVGDFLDLFFAPFALGVGDFFGLGVELLVSLDSDSPRRFFCSSLTCAQRMPLMIAPSTSAVVTQMRIRTTATERNRARDAINPQRCGDQRILKKLQNSNQRSAF